MTDAPAPATTPATPLAIPDDFRSLLTEEQRMKLDFMWSHLSELGKKYFTERDCFRYARARACAPSHEVGDPSRREADRRWYRWARGRYLRARTWDAHKALKQLEASAEWRNEVPSIRERRS